MFFTRVLTRFRYVKITPANVLISDYSWAKCVLHRSLRKSRPWFLPVPFRLALRASQADLIVAKVANLDHPRSEASTPFHPRSMRMKWKIDKI